MSRKKRIPFRWIMTSFVTLAFLLGGYLFLNTQKGLNIAVQLTKSWLPGHLEIDELNGCLLGPIQIKGLHYTHPNTELIISAASLDWHWRYLLQGQLNVGPLSIDKLTLFIKKNSLVTKPTARPKMLKLPEILKHLQYHTLDIHQVTIHTGNNIFQLQGSLHQQWDFHWQLKIPDLAHTVSDLQGSLTLQGDISGEKRFPTLAVSLQKTNLQWQDWQFQAVQSVFHIDTTQNKKWFLDLNASQISHKTLAITPLQLKLSGYLQPFSLQGSLAGFQLKRILQDTQVHSLSIPKSQWSSYQTTQGLKATLTANQGSETQLHAHLLLLGYQPTIWIKPKQPVRAQAQLTLKNLSFLTGITPYLKTPQGLFDAQLNFSGALSSPTIDLKLNLQNASTQIPSLGLYLKKIQVQLSTDKNVLIGTGQLTSGKGELSFHTETQLSQQNFPTDIALQGNNVEISHTAEYKVIISPKLHIQANTKQIATQGLIVFPQARINIDKNYANPVKLSQDVVFVSDKKKWVSFPITFKNNITIQLGDDIYFDYQGLSTQLTGSLAMTQTSDHPILATGELTLSKGAYTYYGQSLQIQPHSSLNFAHSSIDNPQLNITASRKVWVLPPINTNNTAKSTLGSSTFIPSTLSTLQPIQTTVGIRLRGPLENPNIILFAQPADLIKSQLDMLSYLITGQASNQISTASIQLLAHAAANLSGKQTGLSRFISNTQKKIGIDQLSIGDNPIFDPNTNSFQQNTSLIIGKNFSPRLSVSYSLGLLNPISILQINYLLNKNFSLQSTNSNFSNGIDLMYKLERN